MQPKQIVTRFAPSPTGLLHMGNYRTAVFSYLYARKNGGKFILRIEDTDRERSKKEYEDNIIESLTWLGLSYDEKYRQSEHVDSHTAHLKRLIDEGKAYISKEEAKDGSGVMRELVRFKGTGEVVVFEDAIRGRIETETKDLGDFVIARSITEPLFHLAVVVDDHEEGVTHVIRGEDHIPNTPRQILISRALGFPSPTYAHLPLVLAEDRTKLSKRKGALPVTAYRDMGYLPEALLNFMAFIGWNPGGEREIYSLSELEEIFDITKIHKGGAIFNKEKLAWMNKEHMRLQSPEVQLKTVKSYMKDYPDEILSRLLSTIIDRISSYGELVSIEEPEFRFFIKKPEINIEKITWKDSDKFEAKRHLEAVKEILKSVDFSSPDTIKQSLMPYCETNGKGNVLWPLRVSLSGQDKSVDPFTICYVLGLDEVISRIDFVCNMISS
ncbi:MAG: glutamate--tRNA ligase family protein [Candidatus Paceibacterota bacterium]|jgi:glutamyl-tRNA synthetase/nondiscriminating glutamyl-tRNA synthetase